MDGREEYLQQNRRKGKGRQNVHKTGTEVIRGKEEEYGIIDDRKKKRRNNKKEIKKKNKG